MRGAVVFLASLLASAPQACAQGARGEGPAFPVKPVRIVVPFPPGGGSEAFARSIAAKLTERWGQQVLVDNRPGAGGTIGSFQVAKSPPDGYTLLIGLNGTHGIAQSLYRRIPYDTLRDFTPITMLGIGPDILTVHPSVPARSVKELVALARARPNELDYGSPGNGTPPHLQMEVFKKMARVRLAHVPYKGGGPANVALLSGEVQVAFTAVTVGLPHVKAGRLRALGLSGARRPASLREFPTIAASGVPGYDENTWYGMFAPAGLPQPILDRLHADIVRALSAPEVKALFALHGQELVGDSPEHFRATVAAEVAKWARLVPELGLQLD